LDYGGWEEAGGLQVDELAELANALVERALKVDTCHAPANRESTSHGSRGIARNDSMQEAREEESGHGTHSDVTLGLLHMTPSHCAPQGSLPDQLGG
jgi:hypothetical protein